MKPSALDYLVCIHCKGDLSLQESKSIPSPCANEPREIITGSLTCRSCSKAYPITSGVPRLVDHELSSSEDINTGCRFADAWKQFSRIDDSYRQQFFDWIFPVDPDFVKDKLVLEAGLGKGRHSQVVLEAGAKTVFGIDIGNAVDVAYANVGNVPNLHIVQSDIRQLPFRNVFDFAFAVGVLHHMDDPQAGFSSLVTCLAPKGSVCVWVYGKENNWWIINLVSPIRKAVTTKLPAALLKIISTLLAVPVFVTSKMVARPYSGLRERFAFLPEFFYQSYLSYIARFDFTEINHITFDHLIAPIAYYVPREDLVNWFKEAGFMDPVIRWHNKNSWTGFASNTQREEMEIKERLKAALRS